jgi:hypothetical protein
MAIRPPITLPTPNEAPVPTQGTLVLPAPAQSSSVAQSINNSLPSFSALNSPGPKIGINENDTSSQDVDSQIWKILVGISNFSTPQPAYIPPTYIYELVLEHSVIDPCYWRGSAIIKSNRFGILTNPEDNPDVPSSVDGEVVLRGDGKDELYVEIVPIFPGSEELDPNTWKIASNFIIYDSEEIPHQLGMAKKIYFWHKAYNTMLEKSSTFTGVSLSTEQDIYLKNNEDRMQSVSEIIQGLLIASGLEEYIDFDEWDVGDPKNKMFFTSEGNNTVLGEIYRLLPYFISEAGHPGLLYFHRGLNKFQLIGLSNFFEKAGTSSPGDYYYETFIIRTGDTGTADGIDVTPNKTPTISGTSSTASNAILLKKYSFIKDDSYTLSDQSGADSIESSISHMTHTYDHKTKKFKVFFKDSEIETYKDFFKTNYAEKLLTASSGNPLFVLNSTKKEQLRTKSKFVTHINKTEDTIKYIGRNQLVLSTLFLNLGITFRAQGSTHRHAGRFIGIDKYKGSDNRYDYRLLGQWFVTSATTRWVNNELVNEITGNKVTSYEDLRFEENI